MEKRFEGGKCNLNHCVTSSKNVQTMLTVLFALICTVSPVFASEASLVVPNIQSANPTYFNILLVGIEVSVIGLIFGFVEFLKVRGVKAHKSMTDVGDTIFET